MPERVKTTFPGGRRSGGDRRRHQSGSRTSGDLGRTAGGNRLRFEIRRAPADLGWRQGAPIPRGKLNAYLSQSAMPSSQPDAALAAVQRADRVSDAP